MSTFTLFSNISYSKYYLFVPILFWFNSLSANPNNFSNSNIYFTNISSGGTIQSDQSICFGADPTELVSLSPASGGDGSLPIEYLWMQSVPGVSGWEVIPGATGASYNPPALNQTTAFMRCSRRLGFQNYTGETNVVLINILTAPISFITEAPLDANAGDNLSFSAMTTNPLATLTWDFGDGTTANGPNVNHTYNFGGTYTITLTAFDSFTGCSFSTTTEIFVIGPLPVDLAYFYGEAMEDKAVKLSWFTEEEENNNFFEILKSEDGEKFESIAIVQGQGTTEEGTSYEFYDDIPFIGTNYYQLRQIDFSGEYSFSSVVAVEIGKEGDALYTLYPNPASNDLNIRLKESYDYEVFITINDVNQRMVKQFMMPSH